MKVNKFFTVTGFSFTALLSLLLLQPNSFAFDFDANGCEWDVECVVGDGVFLNGKLIGGKAREDCEDDKLCNVNGVYYYNGIEVSGNYKFWTRRGFDPIAYQRKGNRFPDEVIELVEWSLNYGLGSDARHPLTPKLVGKVQKTTGTHPGKNIFFNHIYEFDISLLDPNQFTAIGLCDSTIYLHFDLDNPSRANLPNYHKEKILFDYLESIDYKLNPEKPNFITRTLRFLGGFLDQDTEDSVASHLRKEFHAWNKNYGPKAPNFNDIPASQWHLYEVPTKEFIKPRPTDWDCGFDNNLLNRVTDSLSKIWWWPWVQLGLRDST